MDGSNQMDLMAIVVEEERAEEPCELLEDASKVMEKLTYMTEKLHDSDWLTVGKLIISCTQYS